jgi:hypothetical protein
MRGASNLGPGKIAVVQYNVKAALADNIYRETAQRLVVRD